MADSDSSKSPTQTLMEAKKWKSQWSYFSASKDKHRPVLRLTPLYSVTTGKVAGGGEVGVRWWSGGGRTHFKNDLTQSFWVLWDNKNQLTVIII